MKLNNLLNTFSGTIRQLALIIPVFVIFLYNDSFAQDTAVVYPIMDNTLYEDTAGLISNAKGKYMFAGNSAAPLKRRAVINFQVMEFIPLCSRIESVTLKLHASGPVTANKTIQLRKLNNFCGEGTSNAPGTEENGILSTSYDATWKHRFYSADLWTSPGGDYSGTVSASSVVGSDGFYYWSSPQMKNDVEGWLANFSSGFGWILTGDESSPNSYKRFHTKDADTMSYIPELIVIYSPAIDLYLLTKIEGFWNGTTMVEDTIKVYLRNSFAPYAKVDSAFNLSAEYGAQFCFKNAPAGNYYLQVKHRNTIETWSKLPVALTPGYGDYYDFTDLITKAYGDNEVLKLGSYCFFSGDVNQNGVIDLTDLVLVYNDANNFISGYVSADVNGDNNVDLSDITIVYNNSISFVSLERP